MEEQLQKKENAIADLQAQLQERDLSLSDLQQQLQQQEDALQTAKAQLQQANLDLARQAEELLQVRQALVAAKTAAATTRSASIMKDSTPIHSIMDSARKTLYGDRASTHHAGTSTNPSSAHMHGEVITEDIQALAQMLQEMITKLTAVEKEAAAKQQRLAALEAEVATSSNRLQEASATIQQLQRTVQQQPQQPQQQPGLTAATMASTLATLRLEQELETLRGQLRAVERERDQSNDRQTQLTEQLQEKIGELTQVRQMAALKEQECSSLNQLLLQQQATQAGSATLQQLTDALHEKDLLIASLKQSAEQKQFADNQAKLDTESRVRLLQQQLAEVRAELTTRQGDAVRLAEAEARCASKTQENARLQAQLVAEIGLVENLKASYHDLDRMLNEKLSNAGTGPSIASLQTMMKAKEDHNAYLQDMVATLQSRNQELEAQMIAQKVQSQAPVVMEPSPRELRMQASLQQIATMLAEFFPQVTLTPDGVSDYVNILLQTIREERAQSNQQQAQLSSLKKEKSDLEQKIFVLQRYASGHHHIDQKADVYVEGVLRERNDFEQRYNDAKMETQKKEKELEQLKRVLRQEKNSVLRLMEEAKTREAEMEEEKKKTACPPEYPHLIEECIKICLLGRSAKPVKLETLAEIIPEMRIVRRTLTASMNLLQRENERLKHENKHVKEMAEKEKTTNEHLTNKVREIIRIVQKQGESLKEFVVLIKSFHRRRE